MVTYLAWLAYIFTTGKGNSGLTFRAGAKAPECAGRIHTDMQRGLFAPT